jgi:hypothetical protein
LSPPWEHPLGWKKTRRRRRRERGADEEEGTSIPLSWEAGFATACTTILHCMYGHLFYLHVV